MMVGVKWWLASVHSWMWQSLPMPKFIVRIEIKYLFHTFGYCARPAIQSSKCIVTDTLFSDSLKVC